MDAIAAEPAAPPPAAPPPVGLPDPRRFDPVRFPGTAAPEDWPPALFDFRSPWMRDRGLRFERDAGGGIAMVRDFGHLRVVLNIEGAHTLLDIAAGSRDFLLLRLVPAALRLRETVAPGDPVPEVLRNDEPTLPEPHHLYAATASLVEELGRDAGEEGAALRDALRRVALGPDMIEQAVARCVARSGLTLAAVGPLARRLQRVANAHARVLAAAADQPDYAGMEAAVQRMRDAVAGDRRWSGDLLALALAGMAPEVARPRGAAARFCQMAREALQGRALMHDITPVINAQEAMRDRLTDLGTFWRRTVMAWTAVDPTTTDRRDIEALTRNAARRLALGALYRTEEG